MLIVQTGLYIIQHRHILETDGYSEMFLQYLPC